MQKQFQPRNLAQSYVKSTNYLPSLASSTNQSFYHPRPSTHYLQYSPERMNHSFVAPSRTQQTPNFRLDQFPTKQQEGNLNNNSHLDYKENFRTSNVESENVTMPLRIMEQRMREVQSRIERIEKQEKKTDLIAKSVEEMMHQLKDINLNEELEERLIVLEEMMSHLKNTKLDRNQLENGSFSINKKFEDEIVELWKQEAASKEEIRDTRERLHRLVGKIENTIVTVGEKYQEFIERNIIKSIEHVNKLTHHYHQEIEAFRKEQMGIKEKIESLASERQAETKKQHNPYHQMIAISIPNLKIVQSIAIIDEKKQTTTSILTKEQYQQVVAKQSPKMMTYKSNLINSLYDSIEKSTEQSSTELLLQKLIYKLDQDYYLLDENEHYLVDSLNSRIRLSSNHILLLQEHGLFQ